MTADKRDRMKKKVAALLITLLPTLGFTPIAQAEEHPLRKFIAANAASNKVAEIDSRTSRRFGKMLLGAAIGAGAGLIHSRLTGGDTAKEMAAGAVAGGLIGFAVTKFQDKRLADRNSIIQEANYDPAQGTVTGVANVSVSPSSVKAGDTITVTTTYWAIGAEPASTITLSRFAGIADADEFQKGFTIVPAPFKFEGGGGKYETTLEIKIPAGVPPGPYRVVWLLDGESGAKDGSDTFVING